MNLKSYFFCFTLVLIITSCRSLSLGENSLQNKKAIYYFGNPGNNFMPLNIKGTKKAWVSKDFDATIMLNSTCDHVENVPLKSLLGHLLIGMTQRKILKQVTKPFAKREALESTILAKLDGVPRKMQVLILKKDQCVYDLILSSAPKSFNEHIVSFNNVIGDFEVQAKNGK